MGRNTYRITGSVSTLRMIQRAVGREGLAECKIHGPRAVVTCYDGPGDVWERILLHAGAIPRVHNTSSDTFDAACEDWL